MISVADVFTTIVDDESPVGLRAYDGSTAGPADPVAVIQVRSPEALRYLATAPGQVGLARAYVTGAVDIRGDLYAALDGVVEHVRTPVRRLRLARLFAGFGIGVLRRPPVPPEEARPRWRRRRVIHSRERDAAAIAHHYDLSSRFYEIVLGPTMAYSCAVFTPTVARLDDAQEEKFDLICRKLGLSPGDRLLDVGAGWGGMVRHAAAYYGVEALGVTLSRRQAEWGRRAIAAERLERRVEIRVQDWRDVDDHGFDAVSSIGAMEHFGSRALRGHFAAMSKLLVPGGRMLNHAIARPSNHEGHELGPFLDRYVFPDGELQGPGTVIGAMHDNGFEVRHEENLREHYARTLRAWGENLERGWDEAVAEVGERRARTWRLYMAGSRLGFERGRTQVHQVLGVRLAADGASGMPLRPERDMPAVSDGRAEVESVRNGGRPVSHA
jgi:cyclopropane-fatty-acyl-phospholipid synthase